MAMLAEPRQRKRYNLVPRGKALYEDDSRFGTKMLEKMGWSKGKGLGANEDGSQDFVRVRYKNDIQGLGFEQRDDQWTQHESSFSSLLNSLNGKKSETDEKINEVDSAQSEDDIPRVGFGFGIEDKMKSPKKDKKVKLKENISGISLEEKSKKSKARVHYKKFTRGKDLSQYSEKDLANIFGKKAEDKEDVEDRDDKYQQLSKVLPEIKTEKEVSSVLETFSGVQTISSGISVSDYFKMKMDALKNKSSQHQNQSTTENSDSKEDREEVSIKKSKKKKKKLPTEENVLDENVKKKNKKKKNKSTEREEENLCQANGDPNVKKNKSTERQEENICQANGDPEASISSDVEFLAQKKKHSKKSKKSATVIETEELCSTSKKKQKLDKSLEHQMDVVPHINEEDGNKNADEQHSGKTYNENTNKGKKSKKRSADKKKCIPIENEGANPKKTKSDAVSDQTDLPLQDLKEKINSFNIYRISSFCAEKFRNLNLNFFPQSSLPQIEGYSIDGDVQLKIETIKTDEMRITKLWDNTLSKYALVEKETKQTYQKYVKETFKAKKQKLKRPSLNFKTWKRKNAFTII